MFCHLQDPTIWPETCRYTAIYVGLPSVEEDMVTKDITPQQCR